MGKNLSVMFFIPLCEASQPLPQRCRRLEPEVPFQGCGVGVGDGHVPGLHGHQLLVRLEVIVPGEHAGAHQLLLQDGDEVQQVLGPAVAYVVHPVRGDGQAVLPRPPHGGVPHDAHHALHDVVHVGEVAPAVAVVEDFYRFPLHQLVGESEVGHVGAAGGAVDGEEAQAGAGDVIELAVGVGHELVALLGGGIEAHGVVHLVVRGIRHFLVATVHG